MSDARLLAHLTRHPLTHDQALRLRVLVTFRDRYFSYQPADHRLLALGLALRERAEFVQVAQRALEVAFTPDGQFRLSERSPFFQDCNECQGSGVANEASFLSQRRSKSTRCRACQGKGCTSAPSAHWQD